MTYKTLVDGGYGKWSTFGDCSKSCGGGTQMRTRKCDSPSPANGGKDCFGPNQNFRQCNKQKCPSEYNYSIPLVFLFLKMEIGNSKIVTYKTLVTIVSAKFRSLDKVYPRVSDEAILQNIVHVFL